MKKFDWDKFYNGRLTVRIKTKEEALDFEKRYKETEPYGESQDNFVSEYYGEGKGSDVFVFIAFSPEIINVRLSHDTFNTYGIVNWSDYMEQEEKADSENMNKNISCEGVEEKLEEAMKNTHLELIKSESCKYRLPCGMCELKKEKCEKNDEIFWEGFPEEEQKKIADKIDRISNEKLEKFYYGKRRVIEWH